MERLLWWMSEWHWVLGSPLPCHSMPMPMPATALHCIFSAKAPRQLELPQLCNNRDASPKTPAIATADNERDLPRAASSSSPADCRHLHQLLLERRWPCACCPWRRSRDGCTRDRWVLGCCPDYSRSTWIGCRPRPGRCSVVMLLLVLVRLRVEGARVCDATLLLRIRASCSCFALASLRSQVDADLRASTNSG